MAAIVLCVLGQMGWRAGAGAEEGAVTLLGASGHQRQRNSTGVGAGVGFQGAP